jgi:hypothetical protein
MEENQLLEHIHEEYQETAIHTAPPALELRYTWCYYGALVFPSLTLLIGIAEWWLSRKDNRHEGRIVGLDSQLPLQQRS